MKTKQHTKEVEAGRTHGRAWCAKLALVGGVCLALLSGCQGVRNETVGQLGGAAIGGLLGAQVGSGEGRLAATAVGVVAGLLIGGHVGRQMDEADQLRAQRTLETAPSGTTQRWVNPDSGNQYAVTPHRTYENSGQPCREYTTEAWIDGRKQSVVGTACRDSSGVWRSA